MTLVHNILGVHLFMCSILIFFALIYGLVVCRDITKLCCKKKKQRKVTCVLCKEIVNLNSWREHRGDCARENEWFIDTLPKSKVRLYETKMKVINLNDTIFCDSINFRVTYARSHMV